MPLIPPLLPAIPVAKGEVSSHAAARSTTHWRMLCCNPNGAVGRPHSCLAARPCSGAMLLACRRRRLSAACGLCAGDAAQEVVRLVERALRDSHAVDLEALCVIAGRRVHPLQTLKP